MSSQVGNQLGKRAKEFTFISSDLKKTHSRNAKASKISSAPTRKIHIKTIGLTTATPPAEAVEELAGQLPAQLAAQAPCARRSTEAAARFFFSPFFFRRWRQGRRARTLVERFDIEPFPDFSAK